MNEKQKETQNYTPVQYTKAIGWLDNVIEKSGSRIETLEKNVELLTNNIVDKEKLLSELRDDLWVQKIFLEDATAKNTLLFTIKNNLSVPVDPFYDSDYENSIPAKCIRTRSKSASSTDNQLQKKKGRPRKQHQPPVLSEMDSKKKEKIVDIMDTESDVSNASTLSPKNTNLTPVVSPKTRRKRMYERNIRKNL